MEEQIRLLMEVNAQLSTLLQAEMKQNQALTAKIDELLRQIDELTHKKNSRNSSAPPSSDGYSKPAPKSQRKSSGAKPGGQDGHKGSSMKLMRTPDEIREHYPQACSGCPNREHCRAVIAEQRYESDIIVESRLIEHRQMVCCCPMAENKTLIGEFPKNITGTKQYGNNLKAFAAALSTVGMVGIDRIHELLTGVFDISVSTGSIQNWIKQLSSATKDAVQEIRKQISRLRVLNCDETGLRVNGSLHWLHCLCNENWSYLALHKKRGSKAMDEMDILPGFRNTMVHDFWKPYTKFVVACIILLNVLAVYCYGFCDRMSIIIYYAKIRNISVQYRRTGYSTSK
ncbi:MAG: transposase [Faecousia sp.]